MAKPTNLSICGIKNQSMQISDLQPGIRDSYSMQKLSKIHDFRMHKHEVFVSFVFCVKIEILSHILRDF